MLTRLLFRLLWLWLWLWLGLGLGLWPLRHCFYYSSITLHYF